MRLAVLVAAAVAVAVVVVVVVAYRAAAEQQREALDEALQAQARATSARAALVVDLTSQLPRRADPFAADDLSFQVVLASGRTRRPNGQPALPVSALNQGLVDGAAPRGPVRPAVRAVGGGAVGVTSL